MSDFLYGYTCVVLYIISGASMKCCYMDDGLIENDLISSSYTNTGFLIRHARVRTTGIDNENWKLVHNVIDNER